MKVKCDFVTNSSSTSFIIIDRRKNGESSLIVNLKIDLMAYLEETITEENARILGDYIYSDEEEHKLLEEIHKGNRVLIFSVSDEGGDPVEALLCNEGINDIKLPKGLKVIRGEGGY